MEEFGDVFDGEPLFHSSTLLTDEASSVYTALTSTATFGRLGDWGRPTLGMVTGNNNYFAMSEDQIEH